MRHGARSLSQQPSKWSDPQAGAHPGRDAHYTTALYRPYFRRPILRPTDLPSGILQKQPALAPTSYIAPGAVVVGDVHLADDASVWYNAVLRGDIQRIEVGPRSNIQDSCVLHVTNEDACLVGADVTVGHSANLHACTVEDACLIGIGAIILSGARIGAGSVVGAGAVVREGQIVPPSSLVVGVPSRLARTLGDDTRRTNLDWAQKYVQLATEHRRLYGSAGQLDRRPSQ